MKKMTAILLALLSIFGLVACTGDGASVAEETTAETKARTKVAQPLTWEDIRAIPIADDSMTEEQLRQICLDFMRLQLSFCFTPSDNVTFKNGSRDKTLYYDNVYAGLPYVSSSRGNLYKLMQFYDSDNGMLDVSRPNIMNIIGNQCSASSFWAWARVCNTAVHNNTRAATKANGCLPVGPYTYDEKMDTFGVVTTKQICDANGQQVMYQSYAQLKPADGIVNFLQSGHVRMVCVLPNVVYLPDGSIDGVNSTLTYMDQVAKWWTGTQPDGTPCEIQGGIDVVVSFDKLYADGYLPFTIAELNKADPVEKAEVSTNLTGDSVTFSQLQKESVVSNYAISHIKVTVQDANGKTVFDEIVFSETIPVFEQKINLSTWYGEFKDLADGQHTVDVEATVGTGESFRVFSGILME